MKGGGRLSDHCLSVSTDGGGSTWNTPLAIQASGIVVHSPIIVTAPNHVAYVVWFERSANVNWLKMRTVNNRGASLGTVRTVVQLVIANPANGNLNLKRSNSAANDDTFSAYPFPVVAVNPDAARPGHLYVTYADTGQGAGDKADIFFVRSTDSGVNWTSPIRVNTVGANDQWMPVLAVKPDGTQLFIAWYDRRNDPNNSLIDLYGRWGTIATDGSVSFGTEFRVTPENFPPVFAGTLAENTLDGHCDPVYPPGGVNLNWWYTEWPAPPQPPEIDENVTDDRYRAHVGEYNGAFAEGPYVYVTWTDSRMTSLGTVFGGNQRDIRVVSLRWPQ
jgi:hypothetical protein